MDNWFEDDVFDEDLVEGYTISVPVAEEAIGGMGMFNYQQYWKHLEDEEIILMATAVLV